MTDNQLIAQFLIEKDNHAFEALVKKHQSNIRNFLRRLNAGNIHEADDAAQETFLIVFQKLHTFKGKSKFSTWLHQIAYRCFLKQLDKQNNKLIDFDGDHPAISSLMNSNDLAETDVLVAQLMKHLSVNERLIITLSYSTGMSQSEIVEVTQMPLGTVKSHMNRGKQKLMKLLPKSAAVA